MNTLRTVSLPSGTVPTLRSLIAAGDLAELSDYLVNTLRACGVASVSKLGMCDEINALHGESITPDIAGLAAFLRLRRASAGLPRYRRANHVALFAYLMSRGHLGA